jgi:ribonuclease VapC
MAVDASALVAVALAEADADRYVPVLEGTVCLIGWPTLLEVHMVLARYGKPAALETVQFWQSGPLVRMIAFDQAMFEAARAAFDRFGRGRHPARLNFGDCMAYAIAKVHDVPLLYKGDDFARTDIRAALP